ncbi:YrhA family protein [Terribacillus sp. JSM ZJ617]|uniref:YrhA family protein n=1 Tax=Terribacillus sp. JSM ZJ617 TaxID=3342119 RepID=UPI0035A974E0
MTRWKELLNKIASIEKEYDSTLSEPATKGEITKMINSLKEKLDQVFIPDSYLDFLQNVNGLDFNGLVIYGVDESFLDNPVTEDVHGFIETNELWYENDWQKQYIFFGDSDTAWYAYDTKETRYVELDKPSGTHIQSFESFDAMLVDALKLVL